jgi:SAM-dependent methyltransferase
VAITRHLAHFILSEHLFRPIKGNILLLGRQVVFLTPDQAQALVEARGIPVRRNAVIEYDKNEYGRSQNFISDVSFFSLFCDGDVKACDVSDAEKPDMVFDLSGPLPAGLAGSFDFVYNGSVLDNVFDPAACIRNVSRLLKPSGVVIHYEGAMHANPAYLKFTPDWFFDYYAFNGFEDTQTYFCSFRDVHASPWEIYEWDAFVQFNGNWQLANPMPIDKDAMVVALAQNHGKASIDRVPIQGIYRESHSEYLPGFLRFSRSKRRETIRTLTSPARSQPNTIRSAPVRKQSQSLGERLLAYGRASALKTVVPRPVKRYLAHALAATKANTSLTRMPTGYRYLGTVG